MNLSPDFGKDYIEQGGATFPESRDSRAQIVEYFLQAFEALSQLGYNPDASSLVAAYYGLSDSLRERFDRGEIITKLTIYEAHLVRKYLNSTSSFFGDANVFAIDQVALAEADPNVIELSRNVYESTMALGVPASMIVAYAQGFEQSYVQN